LSLTRSLALKSCAGKSTVVAVTANVNKPIASSPVVDMHVVDDHHDDEVHWQMPDRKPTTTVKSMTPLLFSCTMSANKSLAQSTFVRGAHTDVEWPDMTSYRNSLSKDPAVSAKDNYYDRHTFSYVATTGISLLTIYTGKALVRDMVAFLAPSADVLAMGKVEVKLSDIPEGKNAIIKWRGKPVFIRHRTQDEIDEANSVDLKALRDPESDEARTQKPEWLVMLGVCTHLGCVPIGESGDFGGWFCPCHGSHYDISGRVRKGPAPLNLEVPQYSIEEGDGKIVVG